jgi:hypothetical protein
MKRGYTQHGQISSIYVCTFTTIGKSWIAQKGWIDGRMGTHHNGHKA